MSKGKLKSGIISKNVADYIRRIILSSTIVITIGIACVISIQQYLLFQRISNQQRDEYLDKQKEFIKVLVDVETIYIENQRNEFISNLTDDLIENVNYSSNIANQLYNQYQDKFPDEQVKELIINSISSIEWTNPYTQVFISGMNGKGVYYNGRPDFTGKDLTGLLDTNGNSVILKEIELLESKENGFIHYGSGKLINLIKPESKITYIKKFEPLDWYFGAKCYLEDYYTFFKQGIAQKISLERFRYGGSVYLFETDGTPIVFNGEIISDLENSDEDADSVKMKFFEKSYSAAQSSLDGGYFSFSIDKKENQGFVNMVSYTKEIEDSNWILTASFYEDEVDKDLFIQMTDLKKGLINNLLLILFVLFIVLGIEIFIIHRFNKNYKADFMYFTHFFKHGKKDHLPIEVNKLHFEEFSNMATIANEMMEERSKVHKQLVTEQQKAQESDRLKTAFLANMSHEIRTPMNAIIGFSELLQDNSITQNDKKSFTKLIGQNGEFLMNLINDIIDISKIESNQLNVVKKHFNLNEFLENIKIQFQESLAKREVSDIVFKFENNLREDFVCHSDEFRLKQVLDNLIGNAFKFTNHGHVKLTVHAQENQIHFSIQDTGIGISKKELEAIFERFIQANNNSKRTYGGTGLGLAISKNIIHLLGGDITVQSTTGEGSEFSFYITC